MAHTQRTYLMDAQTNHNIHFLIGLFLAVISSLFIGSSFIIKKIALKKLTINGNLRASAGGYGYLRQWLWWLGLLTMGIGEGANLLAYAFAPAALVTPLGALSILVAAVLSSKYLNENLNFIGKLGCCLCITGSVVIVLHSPKSEEIRSFPELIKKFSDFLFIVYVIFIFLSSFIIKIIFVPRIGNTNIVVYLFMCSAIGSLTVVFCKAVALGIKDVFIGNSNNFTSTMFWFLMLLSVVCIIIQMNYLNKSLDVFNTSLVTPVYYVMFTILVVIASGILFKEWENMKVEDIVGCAAGFLVVVIAILMLNVFKDIQLSLKDLNFNAHRRRNILETEDKS